MSEIAMPKVHALSVKRSASNSDRFTRAIFAAQEEHGPVDLFSSHSLNLSIVKPFSGMVYLRLYQNH